MKSIKQNTFVEWGAVVWSDPSLALFFCSWCPPQTLTVASSELEQRVHVYLNTIGYSSNFVSEFGAAEAHPTPSPAASINDQPDGHEYLQPAFRHWQTCHRPLLSGCIRHASVINTTFTAKKIR